MRLLILGGTIFLGRHLAEQALAAGHHVTLFTRGKHNPDLFPQAERLQGDRDGKLDALRGGSWDAVVDTCGYVPRIMRASARLLAPAVGHYTFVSSISVYRDFAQSGIDEEYPVAVLPDPTVEQVNGETYGGLKALCEQACEEELPGRTLLVRPGLIVGPHDPTDRFTYWPERIARGGEVLCPEPPGRATQVIDVRDLAAWILRLVEARTTGVYNATGLHPPLTFGRLFEECRRVSGSDARFTWLPEEFLLAQEVGSWQELPLWVPQTPDMLGFDSVSIDRALAAGLTFRGIADTIRDTLAWVGDLPADRPKRAGLALEKEAGVLKKWKERS
jgi:2'-hydroxyisoflavone reductase